MSFSAWPEAAARFMESSAPEQIGAWLATYLVHGVALFAIAAVTARFVRSARITEQLWRAALFGPLLTASLQLGAGLQPALGHWELPGDPERTTEAAAAPRVAALHLSPSEALKLKEAAIQARLLELNDSLSGLIDGGESASAEVVDVEPGQDPRTRPGALVALGALALGIAALMLRALLEAVRMHRLGRRKRLMSGPVVEEVEALARKAGLGRGVAVEVTALGESPFATGVLVPRIVLPERALADLDRPSLKAMLAHEIGHVARMDPLWTAAARSVAALFFLQPLNWILLRRLDEAAEFCCDEFAVSVTGNEVALARCLATVAEWIVGSDAKLRAACPMAHRQSPLAERVNRILETEGEPTSPLGAWRAVGGAAVMATALAAPGFAARSVPVAMPDSARPSERVSAVVQGMILPDDDADITTNTSPFAAIARSVRELQGEIRTLLEIAATREVSDRTIERLALLNERAERIASLCSALQLEVDRDAINAR